MTPDCYRLSGVLWSLDPCDAADTKDVYTNHYDDLATALMGAQTDEERMATILANYHVKDIPSTLERVKGYLALSV